jgi:hypothetical protein
VLVPFCEANVSSKRLKQIRLEECPFAIVAASFGKCTKAMQTRLCVQCRQRSTRRRRSGRLFLEFAIELPAEEEGVDCACSHIDQTAETLCRQSALLECLWLMEERVPILFHLALGLLDVREQHGLAQLNLFECLVLGWGRHFRVFYSIRQPYAQRSSTED